jgi:hypothetical protein
LLLEPLREWGVDISAGEINNLLSAGKESFHQEKDDILITASAVSNYVNVNDSGARHRGANGYVTQVGNAFFCLVSIDKLQKSNEFFGMVVCRR